MPKKEKSFLAKAKLWAEANSLHGQNAFVRYVMFVFAENLASVCDDFVFKGGNLLWLYIHTPRATVDLDFATKTIDTHSSVKKYLQAACKLSLPEIGFRIAEFKEVTQQGMKGAAVRLEYETVDGASNYLELDIVYTAGSPNIQIPSPIRKNLTLQVSPLEKIIADKISTCQRFKGGNTRMKDFDDLWRISMFKNIDIDKLRKFLSTLPSGLLNPNWVDDQMEAVWKRHIRRYSDLPKTLKETILDINNWLMKL